MSKVKVFQLYRYFVSVCVCVCGGIALGVQLTQALLSADITCICRFAVASFVMVSGATSKWMNYPLAYTNAVAEL